MRIIMKKQQHIFKDALLWCSRSVDLATTEVSPYQHLVLDGYHLFKNFGIISTCIS